MIAAHQRLRANFPNLLTLIAPRHPERGAASPNSPRAAGLNVTPALARRTAGRRDRHLCRRHGGRTRPDLSPGADRVRRRLADPAWRAESDRARQARRRHPARAACRRISPKSMPRSTPRMAPNRSPTPASSPPRSARCWRSRSRAHRVADGGAHDGGRARRRARAHAAIARPLSDAASLGQRSRPCVSRPSGGARPGSSSGLLAPAAALLWCDRGAAHGEARRARRRAGSVRRQLHPRRRRQDAGGDRCSPAAARGRRAAVLPEPRLWRQPRRARSLSMRMPITPRRSATRRCCWRAPRRPSSRATAWPARKRRAPRAPASW